MNVPLLQLIALPCNDMCPAQAAYAVTEPGAGSDVSGVQMRAVRHGDEWILNGTKVSGSY